MATASPQSAKSQSQVASAVMNRYVDAYRVARSIDFFGTLVKIVGFVLMLFVMGFFYDRGLVFGGFVIGAAVWGFFFILGVLVSAQGQVLKAALDTAINGSPFLTNQHRAKVMSLPFSGDNIGLDEIAFDIKNEGEEPGEEDAGEFCYHCGEALSPGAKTCPSCRKEI